MVYRDKKALQTLQEEYEKAEKPPLDLRLTPTFMRKETNSAHKDIPAAITRVKSTYRSFPAATAVIQPISTVSHRVNNGGNKNTVRPVYAQFEFLP
jgi:hypothetical protein